MIIIVLKYLFSLNKNIAITKKEELRHTAVILLSISKVENILGNQTCSPYDGIFPVLRWTSASN